MQKTKKLAASCLVFFMLASVGCIANNDPTPTPESAPAPTTEPSPTATPMPTPEPTNIRILNNFRDNLFSVLKFHEDYSRGRLDRAEATGSWWAFQLNVRMYSGIERHAYFYAMHGEARYLEEFGVNDNHEIVRDFINNIRAENGFVAAIDGRPW